MAGPSEALQERLAATVLHPLEWRERVDSTNALAGAAASAGVPEGYTLVADVQTRGRGRRGRSWIAPPGTSLLLSVVLRPTVETRALPLLGLLAGCALADASATLVAPAPVALKWPNDLLVGGAKSAGLLVEAGAGSCVLGIGVNVDWRAVTRPAELAGATSLAEAAGRDVDRWQLLELFAHAFTSRYRAWTRSPRAFLAEYRNRCDTLGRQVRVEQPGLPPLVGRAAAINGDGALVVRDDHGREHVRSVGDVRHVRLEATPQRLPGLTA